MPFLAFHRPRIALVMVVIISVAVALSANGSWTTKAPMPTAVAQASVASINGRLYVAGGYIDSNLTLTNLLQVYDPVSNSWTTKAPMPTARRAAPAAAINGKLYVAGGTDNTAAGVTSLEIYDAATDTWTTGAPIPRTNSSPTAANVNGKLYVVAGYTATFNNPRDGVLEVYDPSANTWATKASDPVAQYGAGAVEINGKLYVVGGSPSGTGPLTGALVVYDPATDTWTSKTPMPTPREVPAAAAVNGLLYVIGGYPGAYPVTCETAVTEVYDPTTDTWTTDTPIPTARWNIGAGVINGVIYVAGGAAGCANGGGVPQTVSEAFTPITYHATIRPPINSDGSSIFNASRGVVPVKFTLTLNGASTCQLPPATISVFRTSGGTPGQINQSDYVAPSDTGSNFRIDGCQYVYHLDSGFLGAGTYLVKINLTGGVVGSGTFALR